MTRKEKTIKRIQKIINQTGGISSGELQLDCDVCYGNLGENIVALIEHYNLSNVDVAVYAHDNCIDEFVAGYEDLNESQLDEILQNIENYEANEETD